MGWVNRQPPTSGKLAAFWPHQAGNYRCWGCPKCKPRTSVVHLELQMFGVSILGTPKITSTGWVVDVTRHPPQLGWVPGNIGHAPCGGDLRRRLYSLPPRSLSLALSSILVCLLLLPCRSVVQTPEYPGAMPKVSGAMPKSLRSNGKSLRSNGVGNAQISHWQWQKSQEQ